MNVDLKEEELYKKMYYRLFNAITDSEKYKTKEDIIEFLKKKIRNRRNLYKFWRKVKNEPNRISCKFCWVHKTS